MPAKKTSKAGGLKTCPVCDSQFNMLARSCPRCGYQNDQFFNMPEETRDVYVELWHDADIFRTMRDQANKEGTTVEELYKKAAEAYLDSLVVKKK